MNHIPAVHFNTVVNSLHERSCAMVRKAQHADEIARIAADASEPRSAESRTIQSDAEAAARAYRKIGADARAAFLSIMQNAPVIDGHHVCGVYKVAVSD